MNNPRISMEAVIRELHKVFFCLNTRFYNKELPEPIITIQSANKRKAHGWCSLEKIWQHTSGEGNYEINIAAEGIGRGYLPVVATLAHEMVHLFNVINGITDCNPRNQYHNRNFKTQAETRGLVVHKTKYGYSQTELSDEAKEFLENLTHINKNVFSISRAVFEKSASQKKPMAKSKKWACNCGVIIKSTVEITATCDLCGEHFERGGKKK